MKWIYEKTVLANNIVYCKVCKYWAVQIENNGEKSYWSFCKKLDRRFGADEFCSRGERVE